MTSQVEHITSLQNAKVKLVNKLRTKRGRDRESRFVIDDLRDLERALAQGYQADYVFTSAGAADLPHSLANTPIYQASPDVMSKISYRENPASIVAVMHAKPSKTVDDLRASQSDFILALVDLRKPGNIGALLRTADASGFSAICLIDSSLDIYNPNIIRSSTGTCFLDNVYHVSSAEALEYFRAQGYAIIAAHPDGGMSLYEAQFQGRVAVVMGTEDAGLTPFWLQHSNHAVTIPMAGHVSDSLNVSVSGAIIMYEIYRQHLANSNAMP